MVISQHKHAVISKAGLPSEDDVRALARNYMSRMNLTHATFAQRIGYSRGTMNNFMCEQYDKKRGSPSAICLAIMQYIEQHPIGHDEYQPTKIYPTADAQMVRSSFFEAFDTSLMGGGIQGEPGMGKSEIARSLCAEVNRITAPRSRRALYVYVPQNIKPLALLRLIAEAAGSITAGSIRTIMKALQHELGGLRTLILLDEAQHLTTECIETIRELYDLPPHCRFFFLGSHDFGRTLMLKALQLEQVNSRIYFMRNLQGISDEEAKHIIFEYLGQHADRGIEDRDTGKEVALWSWLIKKSRVPSLRSKGERIYISGRRLFGHLRDLQNDIAMAGKAGRA
jgi:DNA-binding transcriptional regulator YiaG